MVRRTGFSWAEEVEKEEAAQSDEVEKEEATQSQIKKKEGLQRKPNPFGSARPREVVLQERGIDWKILDTKLHNNERIPGKENRIKQRKTTSSIAKKYLALQGHRVPKGHQPAIHGSDFNCRHHALPVPAASAYLRTQSYSTNITETIQCPRIDERWMKEMQRSHCRTVDSVWHGPQLAIGHERQLSQKFDRILENKMYHGHEEAIYIEEQNSHPRNYVEQTRDCLRELKKRRVPNGSKFRKGSFQRES